MAKKLFLLDGMALVYRAHFAFAQRPILTSKGVNTSALYGFTQTLLDIVTARQPTHLAVALDTPAPTQRHRDYPAYKAQREAMPEELAQALPHLRRLLDAFRIPVLTRDGYEADDIIGTLVRCAEQDGFESYMVTPDKDFGQLVDEHTFLVRPGRMGGDIEILGPNEVCARWGIQRASQVIDLLGLMGDASDNIPGVPGIGEKTAAKLIAEFDTLENVLANTASLKGRVRESLDRHRDLALLSKRLATIDCAVPLEAKPDDLILQERDDDPLRALLTEFEFNAIGRRLFGNDFRAGRGQEAAEAPPALPRKFPSGSPATATPVETAESSASSGGATLRDLSSTPHDYRLADTASTRQQLLRELEASDHFALALHCAGGPARSARLLGIAFVHQPHAGWYVPLPARAADAIAVLQEFRTVLENEGIGKIAYDLKPELLPLRNHGLSLRGGCFDGMLAHALIEPDLRHTLGYLAEAFLGYTPAAADNAGEAQGELLLEATAAPQVHQPTVERADLALQLHPQLEPRLRQVGQEGVFRDIEMPLVPVLADMEAEGIRVDAAALAEFSQQLSRVMAEQELAIRRLAGTEVNVNSPKQLGEVLFERLRLSDKPKKTRTGQYATDEATLLQLAEHEIVQRLLEYRACAKLKSTYTDALPDAIDSRTGRVHTTYQQLATSTGRLNSQDPNLQNIPVRSDLGREIRKAFVPRDGDHVLLSADYSQIELRIIAALSQESGLLEAFRDGADVHAATAARVFGVATDQVTSEKRKQAKMVNYGIAYGISAFGLAQRLAIPRVQAAAIIDQYFAQFPGIRKYMADTIEFCRAHGCVQTVTGRRRYLRDINSANGTIRAAAERNAINAPIQGTAADMIKIAMVNIHGELIRRRLRTRMLLQVHDELVFDLPRGEADEVLPLVEEKMRTALPLDVPIVVDLGIGENWLEAH